MVYWSWCRDEKLRARLVPGSYLQDLTGGHLFVQQPVISRS